MPWAHEQLLESWIYRDMVTLLTSDLLIDSNYNTKSRVHPKASMTEILIGPD